jgi:uncharacterized damage-inducible protein DinB
MLEAWLKCHDAIWELWWPSLRELGAEAEREVGGSFPSIRATLGHMVWAEQTWQARLEGAPTPAAVPASVAEAEAVWRSVAQRRSAYLADADPKRLVAYEREGMRYENTVEEIVIHLITHAQFHRGQLASQYRLLGRKPPSWHYINCFRQARGFDG